MQTATHQQRRAALRRRTRTYVRRKLYLRPTTEAGAYGKVVVSIDSPEPNRPYDEMSVAELISLAQQGDRSAREALTNYCVPRLRVWAEGRLPRQSRPLLSTLDVVHEVVTSTFAKLDHFENRAEGALMAYLRTAYLNRVRDEIRKAQARPQAAPVPEELADNGPSPIEETIGREAYERYLAALEKLNERYQQAVVLHVEFGYGLAEIAEAVNTENEHAARMVLRRALAQLAKAMAHAT